MDRWTIGSLLETASGYLREKGSSSPRLDAELLLAETLGLDRIHLYTEYDRPLTASEVDNYRTLIGRRGRHEPVAYILGHAYFRHLRLEVSPAVLIPRPETEELVGVALQTLRLKPPWEALDAAPAEPAGAWPVVPPTSVHRAGDGASARGVAAPAEGSPPGQTTPDRVSVAGSSAPILLADIGTGSGAVALSLAQETGLRVLGVDASAEALAIAARNCEALGLTPLVELRQADLLSGAADQSLRLVVSNPPYVRQGDLDALAPDIRLYEPLLALEGGADGLAVSRRLLPQAARALKPGGSLVLEVGDGQAGAVAELAREAGFSLVESHKDLSQKERIMEATLPGAATAALGQLSGAQKAALAAALEAGAVIGVPTDTVYGLGARWDSPVGVQRLLAAKDRAAGHPLAVMFSSVSAVEAALPDLDSASLRVVAALLPGPFTFVVTTHRPRRPGVGTTDSLGIRVPAYPPLLELLADLRVALAATSANFSGEAEPSGLADVDPTLLAYCAVALTPAEARHGASGDSGRRPADGGPASGGPAGDGPAGGRRAASTVVDLRPLAGGGEPVVLREGTVAAREVMARIAGLS